MDVEFAPRRAREDTGEKYQDAEFSCSSHDLI